MTKTITAQPIFGKVNQVHMVGIGGIGMSSIAEVLMAWGLAVSGSDMRGSENTARLSEQGATIHIGHDARHVGDADVVVYTSAVDPAKNPETRAARTQQIPVINRADMLAALTRRKFGIAIAGTHGKTTTTTLAGHVTRAGGLDPTIIVGGRVHGFASRNAVAGTGDIVVVEADEFDRTFLKLSPSLAVITNIEWEHVDIYDSLQDTRDAFVEFANKVPFYGALIACVDDAEVRTILPRIKARVVSYGLDETARLRAINIESDGFSTGFDVVFDGELLGSISLGAPGIHNVQNALAAVAVGLELRLPFESISQGVQEFSGVFRRFHKRAEIDDILVVDDYAHHPTEVAATLSAARQGFENRRIVAVFQPHLYSRTQKFCDAFGQALAAADEVVVTDVYPAREEPIAGVSGQLVADAAAACEHVHYIADVDDVPAAVGESARPGDLVLFMGAGDITAISENFVDLLSRR